MTPLDAAPDEVGHADVVFAVAETGDYPAWDGRSVGRGVFGTAFLHRPDIRSPFRPERLTAASAPPRADRQDFAAAGGDAPTGFPNQIPQHPPLFYELAAGVVRAERAVDPGPGTPPLDREWSLVRVLCILLLLPLPLLAWLAARRLGLGDHAALAAGAFPLAVPQLAHVGSAVNNDVLLVALGGVLAVLLAGVVGPGGDLRRRTAVLAGVVCALALLTKAFAFCLLAWMALLYALVALRRPARRRAAAASGALAVGVALIGGGSWWLVHALREGALSPSVADRAFSRGAPAGFEPDLLGWSTWFAGRMAERFWGSFGYSSVDLPVAAVVVATALAAVALAAGLWRRPVLAAYGSIVVLLLALVAQHAWSLYESSGLRPFAQGRYLLAGIVPLAVVVGCGVARGLGRWAPLAVLAGGVVLQLVALRGVLAAWWGPAGGSLREQLDAVVAWAAWPAAVSWAVVALALGAAATALVAATRQAIAAKPGS